jgi:hypothetical protein
LNNLYLSNQLSKSANLHSLLGIILFILPLSLKKLLLPDFLRAAQYRKYQENIQSNKYFLSPKRLLILKKSKRRKEEIKSNSREI